MKISDDDFIRGMAGQLTNRLADAGTLILSGVAALELTILKNATEEEKANATLYFMAGAEHVFSSVCTILSTDDTEELQFARLDKIQTEINHWRAVVKKKLDEKGKENADRSSSVAQDKDKSEQ